MAFNGSGTFNRLYSWVTDAANGIKIRADRMDAEMNGMATGLSTCVTRDGQSPWTNDLPAGGWKITGLANGLLAQDAATVGQVQQGVAIFAIGAGTANVLTASYTPTFTAAQLLNGCQLNVRALLANTTAAPTFSPDGVTAHPMVKFGGQPLVPGDIFGPLHELILRYNLANTRWELLNPAYPDAYETGTFSFADSSGAALSVSMISSSYTAIGQFVHLEAKWNFQNNASGANVLLSGLPFNMAATGQRGLGQILCGNGTVTQLVGASATTFATSPVKNNSDISNGVTQFIWTNINYTR